MEIISTGDGVQALRLQRPELFFVRDEGHHYFLPNLILLAKKHGRPQTFFQGRAKIFQGGPGEGGKNLLSA